MRRLLVLTIVATLIVAPLNAANLQPCQMGMDPVDPSWIPPADWSLYKVDRPQTVTMTGGHATVTCQIQPGEVFACPPDNGPCKIVRCKNEIKKRLTGTEIPRSQLTKHLEILASGKIDISGNINVHHSGDVNVHHDGTVKIELSTTAIKHGWCGFWTNTGCTVLAIVVVGGAGIALASGGGSSSTKKLNGGETGPATSRFPGDTHP